MDGFSLALDVTNFPGCVGVSCTGAEIEAGYANYIQQISSALSASGLDCAVVLNPVDQGGDDAGGGTDSDSGAVVPEQDAAVEGGGAIDNDAGSGITDENTATDGGEDDTGTDTDTGGVSDSGETGNRGGETDTNGAENTVSGGEESTSGSVAARAAGYGATVLAATLILFV